MDDWQMMVYACESIDGGVSLMVPSDHFEGTFEEWKRINELDSFERYLTLHAVQLPGDRYFRDAWRLGEKRIEIALSRAREIRINDLRKKRDRRLQELDVEILKAQERGAFEYIRNIVKLKQELRDMPSDPIFQVEKIEDLRHVYPSCLSNRLE